MKKLRFAVFGAGFWSQYQIPGWLELEGIDLVAICDPNIQRASAAASRFSIPNVYTDPVKTLDEQELDFVDIISPVETHLPLARMVAQRGIDVVCQKPLAPSWQESKLLVDTCQKNRVRLFVNENFRWQLPVRRVKQIMNSGIVGQVFKGRVTFCSAFPVFENQPFLKSLPNFILTDIGSHILDICRFLFGEVKYLYCVNQRVNPEILGEDVSNILMKMKNGIHCFTEMSYASILEREAFPETLILMEGTEGSIQLCPDYEIRTTTKASTKTEKVEPQNYPWMDPEYDLIHSSIVDTQKNILNGLMGGSAETSGADNLHTVKLIWAAYQSSQTNRVIDLDQFV